VRRRVVKKTKRTTTIRRDEKRPSKMAVPPEEGADEAEAQIPSYRGPTKTTRKPKPRAGRKAKARFQPAKVQRPQKSSSEVDFGDQKPRGTRRSGGGSPEREQYVRLRIRVSRGRLSVVDSHLVDGPLGQTTAFPGGNAYEVTLGDRLLHAGALPDLGVQRSFPNPKGPAEQRGHYITESRVFEFTARVPAAELTPETIGETAVRLHRVKEETRADRLGDAPLAEQFSREMRPVAELIGLPDSVLPEAIEQRGGRTPSA
jgi:hypothetical protein